MAAPSQKNKGVSGNLCHNLVVVEDSRSLFQASPDNFITVLLEILCEFAIFKVKSCLDNFKVISHNFGSRGSQRMTNEPN